MKKKQLIRHNFREGVFQRDNHKCVFCGETQDLDAHHIIDRNDMPNGGYVKENGITLCKKHHMLAERYHITKGQEWIEGMHPYDLFRKIGSKSDLAIRKARKLNANI